MVDGALPGDDLARLSNRDLGLRVNGQTVLSDPTELATSSDCQSELNCWVEVGPSAGMDGEEVVIGEPRSGCHETDFFDLA